jgi:rhamnopyranosyl-N-acetylglucosaminyl-diphospho-decaprenol beta-1,3/1,4-galactofuranosyltransferase
VLQTLLEEAKRWDLAVISPVVVNIDDPERLAFPLRRGLTWKRQRSELGTDFLPGIASFFNGALFSAEALEVVGVPDYRLFLRGDEVEVHRRLVRSGLRFGTTLRASYAHPDGSAEFKPMLRGHFHAQDPVDDIKRYYTYRNRGYLLSQPGMRRIGMLEVLRFGLYFLGTKRDPRAFRRWIKLLRQGRAERFYRY